MKILLIAGALSSAMTASAWADGEDGNRAAAWLRESGLPASLSEPVLPEAAGESADASMVLQDKDKDWKRSDDTEFSFGPVAGYIKVRDADRGTWFGGVQMRLRFVKYLAVEASISFHHEEFQSGDIEVTTYPVQVSALVLPFPDSPIEPYALFGAGWYYTRIDIENSALLLPGEDDSETDRSFGFHIGAGVLAELGKHFSLFADFRWIFMDEPGVDNGNIDDEEFDSGQITLGGSFRF